MICSKLSSTNNISLWRKYPISRWITGWPDSAGKWRARAKVIEKSVRIVQRSQGHKERAIPVGVLQTGGDLQSQPALADPRRAEQGHQSTAVAKEPVAEGTHFFHPAQQRGGRSGEGGLIFRCCESHGWSDRR